MCILFIAINQHPDYPLVIAANRDEFHARQTQAMHWWQDTNPLAAKGLLAGKDLEANGTWLGVTDSGQFAALTNYRQLPLKQGEFQSRGALPLKALSESTNNIEKYLNDHADNYQGFNLLYGNAQNLVCFDSIKQKFTPISTGFHSVCNGSLDDVWPKMAKGEQALERYIREHKTLSHEALFALLQDTETAPEALLPNTGIGLEWEKMLSAIFIKSESYGTRSSCVLTQSNTGEIKVSEQIYSTAGHCINKQSFNWQLKHAGEKIDRQKQK